MVSILILALAIALLAVVFAIQNNIVVKVSFLFWETEGSLALILLITFILGVLVGIFVLIPRLIKAKKLISAQKKEIERLKEEVKEKEKTFQETFNSQ
jgi:uncharacterized integral membrane protein